MSRDDAVDEDVGAEQVDEHGQRRLRPDEREDAERDRGDSADPKTHQSRATKPSIGTFSFDWN